MVYSVNVVATELLIAKRMRWAARSTVLKEHRGAGLESGAADAQTLLVLCSPVPFKGA
jgi:hypothetical protein